MPATLRDPEGSVYPLQDFTLIGRGDGATIHLQDGGISRQHATIRRDGDLYWLVDLGSANGSYVNDVAVTAPRVLHAGDRLVFGRSMLVFDQDEPPATPANAPFSPNKTQVSGIGAKPVRLQAATLFVGDLRGFTALSAQIPADQVADLLREWYADCNAILGHYGATVDKFIGDCVFAYWHSDDIESRTRALHAARALQAVEHTSASPTRAMLRESRGIVLDCRIGLHIGDVAIGAMGKGVHTALGDAVNVAFRLEALTRSLDRTELVSAAFLEGWPEGRLYFEACGRHPLKGIAEPMEVFSLRRG